MIFEKETKPNIVSAFSFSSYSGANKWTGVKKILVESKTLLLISMSETEANFDWFII